jgi:serine/threonine-protein kinase
MDPASWQKLKESFYAALDLPPGERSTYLEKLFANDPQSRAEIEALLQAHEKAGEFIEAPAFEQLQPGSPEPEPLTEKSPIGPYRLLRELGRGGMGVVYLAVRDDEVVKKQVALKIIQAGMTKEIIARRFRAERQALATLEHPNIARFLDGGFTEDSRPYYVMEYVEGEPIHRFCDSHRLSIRQRLELFRRVCAAVQYAHQNLIVHRDLKPDNILVTPTGVPKLLDFGIAKMLKPELSPHTLMVTKERWQLMTPAYASPEQVRGDPITTASDVYSLGVLLYELLCGHRPYRFKSRTPREIERVICEQEPERPSTAITRVEETGAEDGATTSVTPEMVSKTREGPPEKLKRRLAGDLDNIVMMAMRKEPQRRYASVEQFSEDIRRHLQGLPVIARKDTLGYRGSKFVKRHKTGVVAVALVILTLVGGIVATFWQAKIASDERDKARIEAAKAERINSFLQEMLSAADPFKQGKDIKVAEMLNEAAKRAHQELSEMPEIEATVLNTIGQTYYSLGLFKPAEQVLGQALSIRETIFGPEHPDVAEAALNLSKVVQEQGDLERAETLLLRALKLSRTYYGEEHELVGRSLTQLAVLSWQEGNYEEAAQHQRRANSVLKKIQGNQSLEVIEGVSNLAVMLKAAGKYEEAEPFYRQAIQLAQNALGEDHPTVSTAVNNYAVFLYGRGRYEESVPHFRSALRLRIKHYGERNHHVATVMGNLGNVLRQLERFVEAEALLRKTIAIEQEVLGQDHPGVAFPLHNLAALLHQKGDYAASDPFFREALRIRRQRLGNDHPYVAATLVKYSRMLMDRGDAETAEPMLREALTIRRKKLDPGAWEIADSESALGGCLVTLGRFAEAESLLIQGYQTLEASRGHEDHLTQTAIQHLIKLYRAWGKPEQAARYEALQD